MVQEEKNNLWEIKSSYFTAYELQTIYSWTESDVCDMN